MFFEVGFIIMMPLVIGIAKEAKYSHMALVIPSLAALAQAHSLLPPQPGPVALMTSLGADSGLVYMFGLVVLIPSIICEESFFRALFLILMSTNYQILAVWMRLIILNIRPQVLPFLY